MQAKVLANTLHMDRKAWLEARKQGLGGSDVATIAGLSKWKSQVQVFLEKTQAIEQEDVQSEAYFGNVLEEVVAQEFAKRTGLKVQRRNAILQHPAYPWMLANVDRLIVGERIGLECKTASEYLKKWEGEEIPVTYLLQCQHYMAVTGYEAWWIAVLIGGNKFVYKRSNGMRILSSILSTWNVTFGSIMLKRMNRLCLMVQRHLRTTEAIVLRIY